MGDTTQYFKINISSPEESKEKVSLDVTKYVDDKVKIINEDGLLKECSFDMQQAYLMLDVLSIGMIVTVVAGTLYRNEEKFVGFIKEITPDFKDGGEVVLRILAYSNEGKKLGVGIRDVVYPSKNHPKDWARKEVMYSDIISNLAKDTGIIIKEEDVKVYKDIKAGFAKGTVRQKNMTDWAFMQHLAEKIHCTLWTEEKNGTSYLKLIDDSLVVNTLAEYTFFFLARKNATEFIDYTKLSDKQIQIVKAKVNLDTQNNKGKLKQVTNSETGKTEIVTDKEVDGRTERWVLDEDKVKALSFEERNKIIELFASGRVTWEGERGTIAAKDYFKKQVIGESSREGEPNNTEIEVANGDLKADGINTQNPDKENTGSKTFKTVIDSDKLKKLSPEKRSAVLGRIARGEISEEDKTYYKVVDNTPKEGKDESTSGTKTADKVISSDKKEKRDAGFNIEATIFGNQEIIPRKSYVVEGLGKYSEKYYLYKTTSFWGKDSFMMELVFTR